MVIFIAAIALAPSVMLLTLVAWAPWVRRWTAAPSFVAAKALALTGALVVTSCGRGAIPLAPANPRCPVSIDRPSPSAAELPVRGLEGVAWGMWRQDVRALHPSLTENADSGCLEGEGAIGGRSLHVDLCFGPAGLRMVSATLGSTIQPGFTALLDDVVAELDRKYGRTSAAGRWTGVFTVATHTCRAQSGYGFCFVQFERYDAAILTP